MYEIHPYEVPVRLGEKNIDAASDAVLRNRLPYRPYAIIKLRYLVGLPFGFAGDFVRHLRMGFDPRKSSQPNRCWCVCDEGAMAIRGRQVRCRSAGADDRP